MHVDSRWRGLFFAFAALWALASPAAWAQDDDNPRRTPIVRAVERATPAVVTVKVEVPASSPFLFYRQERRASEGSGVIIDAGGVVLTNAHVVDGAQRIDVHLQDGRTLPADVVAQDRALDLAVLRTRGATDLPTLPLGDSDALLLGEPAIAIGNPFGLGLTVSTGVISSTARDVPVGNGPVQTYIQTDAAINPGNSGGALVDIEGRLIGINTFIHASAEGVGFAIPVNRARKVALDLLMYGQVQLPWLGFAGVDVPPGRNRGALAKGGVLVERVHGGELRVGDVVVSVDGHVVHNRADLNARLAERAPGDVVRVGVVRSGGVQPVSMKSRKAPENLGAEAVRRALRIETQPVRGGIQVTTAHPEGTWVGAGLRAGDVLIAVDGQRVGDGAALEKALGRARAQHRARVWLTVARGPYRGTVEVAL